MSCLVNVTHVFKNARCQSNYKLALITVRLVTYWERNAMTLTGADAAIALSKASLSSLIKEGYEKDPANWLKSHDF